MDDLIGKPHLERTTRQYRDMFDHAPLGICQTTGEGKILTANAAFAAMLGYDAADALLNENIRNVYVTSEDRVRLVARFEAGERVTGRPTHRGLCDPYMVLPCWIMPEATTREQLRSWIEGQEIANGRQREALAAMSAEEKLRQISRLMSSARLFDMSRRAAGDHVVRDLWQRLRERWPDGE